MPLNFFGLGSGFSNEHTSAYFKHKDDLILIDLPMSTYTKIKMSDLIAYREIFVLITHTHADHISGLGIFVQFCYFCCGKKVHIVAPSDAVKSDLKVILDIEGNDPSWYTLVTASDLDQIWLVDAIPTKHSPQLVNKCFGYCLNINGLNVVYSGDTSTLDPYLPYLKEYSILYIDVSVHYGAIHCKLEDILPDLISIASHNIKINLMHLDDPIQAKQIIEPYTNIEIAPLLKSDLKQL